MLCLMIKMSNIQYTVFNVSQRDQFIYKIEHESMYILTRLNDQYNLSYPSKIKTDSLYYRKTWSNEFWYTIE